MVEEEIPMLDNKISPPTNEDDTQETVTQNGPIWWVWVIVLVAIVCVANSIILTVVIVKKKKAN